MYSTTTQFNLTGRYEDFTIERLVKMLERLGKTVEINVLEAA